MTMQSSATSRFATAHPKDGLNRSTDNEPAKMIIREPGTGRRVDHEIKPAAPAAAAMGFCQR
jgi:hypothetical protein